MADARPRVVLASASPRRRDLLAPLGLDLVVRPADIDEAPHQGEMPEAYVERLAREKAAAVVAAGGAGRDDLVIAADTTVDVDGRILEKPVDTDDADRMLRLLSGRTHLVHTGVAVRRAERVASRVVTSSVTFVPLTDAVRAWYVATGEPMGKAGAYAVQGAGGVLVAGVGGSPSNVVGLPLATTVELARQLGVELLAGTDRLAG